MAGNNNVNNIYSPFKRTLVMELVETRIDELSDEQIEKIFPIINEAQDAPFILPRPDK